MIRILCSRLAIPTAALLLIALASPASWDVRAQQKGMLDLTFKSCADFSAAESHLDAAFHTVVKGYKSILGRKEPVAELEGVDTPEKVQEFMT